MHTNNPSAQPEGLLILADSEIKRMISMVKRIFSFFLVIVLVAFVASSCNANEGENNAEGGKIDSEVTDLQLALLNKTLYIGSLTEFEGVRLRGYYWI